MENDKLTVRTSLRLPVDLHKKLHIAAGSRTMHAEILDRLEKSFEPESLDSINERLIERVIRQVLAEKRTTETDKT